MTDRYTKKDADLAFARLQLAMGKHGAFHTGAAGYWVGGWALDHNSVYGGYVIHEISNTSGGVSEPFGSQRHNAREFCSMVSFALSALRIAKDALLEA